MAFLKLFCFSQELFFGTLIILFGVAIICKAIFKINLPLFPIFGGIALIYLGINILTQNLQKECYKKNEIYNSTFRK